MAINLQNTPSAGPLTEADMERYRNLHRAYIPMGCDEQGRRPEATPTPSDGSSVGLWGAFIPAWRAIALVAACAALALLLKDFAQ
jgi:hypothetical protein